MRTLILTACTALCITAAAQEATADGDTDRRLARGANSLAVSWADGAATQLFALGEIEQLTFDADDGSVCITTVGGAQTMLTEESAWSAAFTFREQGQQEEPKEEDAISTPLSDDGTVEIWSLSGQKMHSAAGTLPHGVYVVKSRGKARKITL